MTEVRAEDLTNSESVGAIADLSNWSPSGEDEDDVENDSDRKELEEEINKIIMDFIKRHPLQSVEENGEFWEDVINRFRDNRGLNLMTLYSFARFDIINEMHEHLIDEDIV